MDSRQAKIGYDFDGIFVSDIVPTIWFRILITIAPRRAFKYFLAKAELLYPELEKGKKMIITGRLGDEQKVARKQLNAMGVKDCIIYPNFRDRERRTEREAMLETVIFKAGVINLNDLEVFYESSDRQYNLLLSLCPNCKIKHLNNNPK